MQKRQYITGLDGLRALAVTGVILYHLLPQKVPGGYLGVPLFFVISGYLMTSILSHEWNNRKKINLKKFYIKRVRRIYPSLLIMLVVSSSFLMMISSELLLNFRSLVASTLLNMNNWWQVANGMSYFDLFNNESPYTHLWSLSIEGQFYIFWPIILALLFFFLKDSKKINYIVIGAIGLSAIWMGIGYHFLDINRIYYGTDTRIYSVLIGASLAFILEDKQHVLTRALNKYGVFIGVVSLIGLLVSYNQLRDTQAWVYQGGMFLVSIMSALLLGVIVRHTAFNQFMTNRIFRWIGTRSYEIYLWQLPVMVGYNTLIKWNGQHLWFHLIIQLLVIGLFSEGTYLASHFLLSGQAKNVFSIKELKVNRKSQTMASFTVFFLFLFVVSLFTSPVGRADSAQKLEEDLKANAELLAEHNKKNTLETTSSTSTSETEDSTETTDASEPVDTESTSKGGVLTPEEVKIAQELRVGAIGDSVLLSAAPAIQNVFPKSYIDAEVGRQLMDSEETFAKFKKEDLFGDVVLVDLGTNGSFKESDITTMMSYIGDRPVYFVNTMVDRPWQKAVNDELNHTVDRYENAHLIDWKSISAGHTEWFEEDNVHLIPDGADAFASIIAKQIIDDQLKDKN